MPLSPVRLADTLTSAEVARVREIQAAATAADGVSPLSEQPLLSLDAPSGRVRHLLGYAAERLTGYAQLDGPTGPDASAELVVDPAARRQGTGRALLDAVFEAAPGARLWAHGRLPAAQALAASAGLAAVRELHKMARPLGAADLAPAASALPEGFHARAFEPGRDEQAWLATNAAAFAHHPEQGRLTLADLEERMAQPWFDAAGFILVEADATVLDAAGISPIGGIPAPHVAAFHWTKVDPEQRSSVDPTKTAGEVYVVGVHPAYQGRGLGRPVTALGLAHLAGLGLAEVVLYVDGDNQAAIRTYTGLGFRSIMVDVMYALAV
ncbi:mycothiol synthase [Phycicoccus sp. Soil802]|uniref:mycothiol synthase n=1 Tax=Phycicoccus sp. Soil802 TaxID=1736414 RepID=UPI001F407DDE|nr:mycothiol synthase [Phycicoccus sp. Soil802]